MASSSTLPADRNDAGSLDFLRSIFTAQRIPLFATVLVFVAVYVIAGIQFAQFRTLYQAVSLLQSNAVLGIVAVGMTFVILSGGIDLSVGSVVACTGTLAAILIERKEIPAPVVVVILLLAGTVFGLVQGCLIHFFETPPFLITLGGMFFTRGIALVLTTSQINIKTHREFFSSITTNCVLLLHAKVPGMKGDLNVRLAFESLTFLAVLLFASIFLIFSRFGRNTYAIGGSENSSLLMGLPVARTKVSVYAISGFCATLAGLVNVIVSTAGNPAERVGFELDAITAVVIGGTLLTGGVGYMPGTLIGTLIAGLIASLMTAKGDVPSSLQKVFMGQLLLAFVLLQKLVQKLNPTGPSGSH